MKKVAGYISTMLLVVVLAAGVAQLTYAKDGEGAPSAASKSEGHSGSGDAAETSNGGSTEQTQANKDDAAKKAAEAEQEQSQRVKLEAAEKAKTSKTDGDSFLAQLRQSNKEHAQAERTKNCQARQKELVAKLQHIQGEATNFQKKVDSTLAAAITYMSNNNISSAGLTQLVSAAQAAQTTAKGSVQALAGLSITVDCTNPNVAEQVATFRAAVAQARTDLNAYKTKVRALFVALETLKAGE
jgi:hypothetical protein